MTTLASLRILLGLDSAGVKAGSSEVRSELGLVRADAQRTATTVNTAAADMSRSLGGVGTSLVGLAKSFAGIAAVTSAGAFFADSIKGAIEEEEGIGRLTASLEANVSAWDGNRDAIERTIKAREELGFSDDDLRSSLTGLVGATQDVNEALDIQSVALDLARFKHISLAEASDALTKVEAGSFRILKSLGIELQEGATQTEALAAVQKLAAGQAQEFAESTAGAGAAAAVAFHDAQEEIGTALLPLLKETAAVVKDDLAPALHDAAGAVVEVVKVGNDLADVFNEIVALGPKVHDAIVGARPSAEDIAGQQAALRASQEYAAELRRIDTALADGTITQDDAAAATTAASDAYRIAISVAEGVTRANGDVTDSLGVQADTALTAAESFRVLGSATVQDATFFRQFTDAAGQTGAGLDNIDAEARAAALGLDVTRGAANDLTTELNLIPRDIAITISLTTSGVAAAKADIARARQAGEDDDARGRFGGPEVKPFEHTGPIIDPGVVAFNAAQAAERERQAREAKAERERQAREAQSARDKAAREAEQKARESARQQASDYQAAMSAAFDKISADAHKVFDAVHAANLKIIRDAHDTANAQLDEQERAIRGFVSGEQAKLDAERAHRRELELRADVTNAISPEDRARAQQALNDFLADQRIAFLNAQADTQVAALDAARTANDATAAQQTQAENDRFKAQTTAFDQALKALEDGLKRHPELWKSSQENVLKLLLKYDVDYKKAGEAMGTAFAQGLLATTLAVEQAARGVAVAGARAEGNVIVAPPVIPVPGTTIAPPKPGDASYAAVTLGYSKGPAPESVQRQITPMGEWAGGGKLGDVYLDADKVGEFYAKRGATLDAIYNPVPVSIGPKR